MMCHVDLPFLRPGLLVKQVSAIACSKPGSVCVLCLGDIWHCKLANSTLVLRSESFAVGTTLSRNVTLDTSQVHIPLAPAIA